MSAVQLNPGKASTPTCAKPARTGRTFPRLLRTWGASSAVAIAAMVLVLIGLGALVAPAEAQQVLSGSYTGNNASTRAITGLGFQPDAVFIRGDADKQGAIRT